MKKSIKLLSLFIVAIVALFVGKELVMAADNAPSSFKASTSELSYIPIGLDEKPNIKKTTDGKYVFCLEVRKWLPSSSVTYTKGNLITDPIYRNIIISGANDKTDSEYFATQAALWIYLYDTGKMDDTDYKFVQTIKKNAYSSKYENDPVAKDIRNILAEAKKAETIDYKLDITTENANFTLKDGVYTSNVIKVNNANTKDYTINASNKPEGTKINKVSGGFVITIPESSIEVGTTSFKVTVTNSYTKYNVYKYNSSASKYQDMAAAFPETVDLSDSITLSLTREPEPTVIYISKQDITNKEELPGATLVIKDENGKVVKEWVSTNEPYKYEKITVGKYTLSETIAPEGYDLTTETINFEVKKDGKIEKVVMYNTPNSTKIIISKQDITNKEELPGATLVIKDEKGKIVEKWVSTNKPKEIENLKPGKYTLSETIAPEGFELSTETIKFEVKKDGKVEKVVMYNVPEKEIVVSISKKDITTKEELPGATLVVRDSKGKELYKWVSGEEPYIIKGIKEGKYTLEETIAPEGYKLSTEKISFEVKKNGVITEVVMFNTPVETEIVEVPATGMNATTLSYIFGGLVIMMGSVLIYRNVKREQ